MNKAFKKNKKLNYSNTHYIKPFSTARAAAVAQSVIIASQSLYRLRNTTLPTAVAACLVMDTYKALSKINFKPVTV